MTTAELLNRVRQNDQAAFEQLYNQYYQMGFSLALQFVKNEQDAMDIMQDAFMTVCSKLDTLENADKFQSWYMQIVANKCRNFLSKKNPMSFTAANAYDENGALQFDIEDDNRDFKPEEAVDYTETVRIVDGMLDNLPADQKMCLILYYVNGLKISEIAESLEISEATVKSRLKYGKDKLRAQVEDYEKETGTKLRGVAGFGLIPFIKWMINGSTSAAPTVATATTSTAIKTAAEVGKIAAKTAAKKGATSMFAKIAGMSIAQKVISAAVAGAVFIGGAIGVVNVVQSDPLPKFDMSKYITFNTYSYEQDGIVYYDIDYETATEDFLALADKEEYYEICEECFTTEEIERGITLANFIHPGDEYDITLYGPWSIEDDNSVTFLFSLSWGVEDCLFPDATSDQFCELFEMMGVDFDQYATLKIESLPEMKYVEPETRRMVNIEKFVEIDVVELGEDEYRVDATLKQKELLLELLQCSEEELDQIGEFETSNPDFFISRNIDPKNFNARLELALENIELEVWNHNTCWSDNVYTTVFSGEDEVNIILEGICSIANIFGVKFDEDDYSGNRFCVYVLNADIPYYFEKINENSSKDLAMLISPNSITIIGIGGCTDKDIIIPSYDMTSRVVAIDRNAFKNCTSITTVTIPKTVTDIKYGAFSGCTSLSTITIPNSVKYIGANAFFKCSNLDTIIYDGSISEWNSIYDEADSMDPIDHGEINVICTDGIYVLPACTVD